MHSPELHEDQCSRQAVQWLGTGVSSKKKKKRLAPEVRANVSPEIRALLKFTVPSDS